MTTDPWTPIFNPDTDSPAFRKITAYAHWWATVDSAVPDPTGKRLSERGRDGPGFLFAPLAESFAFLEGARPRTEALSGGQSNLSPIDDSNARTAVRDLTGGFGGGNVLAGEKGTGNSDHDPETWATAPLATDRLTKDTVIVGVIDEGIALGHARFRLPAAPGPLKTRILSAWLQGAYRDRDNPGDAAAPPFGIELDQHGIEALMADHDCDGDLDETAFNRAVDAHAPEDRLSSYQRSLGVRVSHGTHVLDLAAGADPEAADPDALSKVRIVAVNLPARMAIGMAGTFLEYYAILGMMRIVQVADQLWRQSFGDAPGGFPIVMNISYGQQAGPKTATSRIEQAFEMLRRGRSNSAPLRLVMPIGNDNLTRSNARWSLERGKSLEVPWRILPEDHSANFVEVWTDLYAGEAFPLRIELLPPGETRGVPLFGRDRHFADLAGGTARVYAEIHEAPLLAHLPVAPTYNPPRRMQYVIALRPTTDHARPDFVARPGLWRLRLSWADDARFDGQNAVSGRDIYVNVQVDQSPDVVSFTSHRSYFDARDYRTHDAVGRPLDTYSYTPGLPRPDNNEPANVFWPVQRKGTHNTLSTFKLISTVAAYRESDGRPNDFSATVYPISRIPAQYVAQVAERPTAAFPADPTPTLLGVRAAGVLSGSTARLRGTSFAAAQATRWTVADLRAHQTAQGGDDLSRIGTPQRLADAAEAADPRGDFPAVAAEHKIGAGRMRPQTGRGMPPA